MADAHRKKKFRLTDFYDDKESHRNIIKVGLVFFLLLEATIYFGALGHSGPKYYVRAYDGSGNRVYETPGKVMTYHERRVFESAYGPLDRYHIETEVVDTPFPFRAWLAAAVGAPIGLALLLIYLLRVYLTFLSGPEKKNDPSGSVLDDRRAATGRWLGGRGLSIFHLGLLLVLCLLAVWLIPNYVATLARGVLGVILRFKWFSLGVLVFLAALVVWVIYLRYRMALKMMESNVELEKFRVQKKLELEMGRSAAAALPESTAGEDVVDSVEFEERPAEELQDQTHHRSRAKR